MTSPTLPEGTVTFLFTDIEGSTQLLSQLRERYAELLADQRRILRAAFARWQGQEVDTQGDAFFVAFPRATQAVCAAVDIQRSLTTHTWPQDVEVRVRMGIHTGEPLKAEEGYVGMDVHRAARIAHVGHGGQVLLSETTTALVRDELPQGVSMLDLGGHRLKDLSQPEYIRQLVIEGLPGEFPSLKSLELLPPEISLELGEVKSPEFLEEQVEERTAPVFVGRERELGQLEGFMEKALHGNGGMVFVTGGPGRGKSALLEAFSKRVMAGYSELLAVMGVCNAYTGIGDPYLPFREVLGMLTGEIEYKWAAGTISLEHARRLWLFSPNTAKALVEYGPDLVEALLPGKNLVARMVSVVPDQRNLLQALRALAGRERPGLGGVEQRALFEQYWKVLSELADKQPLLIMLDDLQWADSASLNLLFHLGRNLEGKRILILGAYRPEEVVLRRGDSEHPLGSMLNEFKRQYGQVWISLSEAPENEGRQFVDAYLDSEPNRLGARFREAMFSHTRGHPLFTVELLRDLHERGDLIKDEHGRWVEGSSLDWAILPARVEGVIETRLGRLEPRAIETLAIASVIGEEFIAEVIAQVQNMDIRELINLLSRELDKKHRLVSIQSVQKINDQRLSVYRFNHNLFQKYLYNNLDKVRRTYLHEDIANIFESLFADQSDEIATELAWHFQEAGITDKAIHYLYQAGVKALAASANVEAVTHFSRGLKLVNSLPEGIERVQQEFYLQSSLFLPLVSLNGYADPEVSRVIQRSLELGKQVGNPPQLFLPVLGLGAYYGAMGDYRNAKDVWSELLALGEASGDPLLQALSHWLGWVQLMSGELDLAYGQMRAVIDEIIWEEHMDLPVVYGVDPGSTCRLWASWALWFLGYPKQAWSMLREALITAKSLKHPHTQAFVLGLGCYVLRWIQEYELLNLWSQQAIKVSRELGNNKFLGDGLFNHGIVLVRDGQIKEGIDLINQGMSTILETGTKVAYSANLAELANIYLEVGDTENGLATVEQALNWVEASGERFMEAEVKRLKGELLIGLGESGELVEGCFQEAIDIAQRRSAKSLELRATSSLCRLLRKQGRDEEAYKKLVAIYSWFTEGLDTPDLVYAKSLLLK